MKRCKTDFCGSCRFLVVAGQTSPQFGDADRFYKRLETMKKRAGRGTAEGLQMEAINTSLTGPALLNDAPGVIEKVTTFIKTQLGRSIGQDSVGGTRELKPERLASIFTTTICLRLTPRVAVINYVPTLAAE
jgi:hypothetical protein